MNCEELERGSADVKVRATMGESSYCGEIHVCCDCSS